MTLTLAVARAQMQAGSPVTDEQLARLTGPERAKLTREARAWLAQDRKRNQLVHYRVVNPDAVKVHAATAREVGIQGGNKSTKTGTMLAEFAIQATGIVPRSLASVYPVAKLRGRNHPITARLVVTSLTSAWDTNLKKKLQWFAWNGKLNAHALPGDPRYGHWGWVPQQWLIRGDWDESWSEKHRTLTLWHPELKTTWSTLQVMSQDQSLTEFNQGAFDLILEDELPSEEIHRANRIRAMEKHGQIYVGGTPPDDRSSAVTAAWFFDQVVTPGLEGSDPEAVQAVALWTERNETLDPEDVAAVAKGLSPEQQRARLHGEAIHLSGLVVKGFTEKPKTWCFRCVKPALVADGACVDCRGRELATYAHVWGDDDHAWPGPADWPTLFYMDPHQAKPTACIWVKVDPLDQWWQIHEAEIAGDAATVKRECERFEREHGLTIAWRKGDPKITAQGNQFAREVAGETFTIRKAFEEAGFPFEDANTNFTVAIDRLEQALVPNAYTKAPRLRAHRSCRRTIYQVTHFTWPATRKDPLEAKDQPQRKHSDFPATLRYLCMDDPEYRAIQMLQHHERLNLIGAGRDGRNKATGW